MKLAFITIITDDIKWYGKYTKPIQELYCKKYGYTYIAYDHIFDTDRWVTWSKISAILETMTNTQCDYVFWCDADSIPIDMTKDLSIYLDVSNDIILELDKNETEYRNLYSKPYDVYAPCTGNILIKNNKRSINYLNKLKNDTKYKKYYYKTSFFHEQSALTLSMLDDDYKDLASIKTLEYQSMTSNQIDNHRHFFHAQDQLTPIFKKTTIKYFYDSLIGDNL